MPGIPVPDRREHCYKLGSLFVGSTGGAALGYFTKLFNPKQNVDKLSIKVKSEAMKNNKHLQKLRHIQLGGMNWRIGLQTVGAAIAYSFLECKFQGGWPKRGILDCAFAGAITGGALGLRGIPGGKRGVGLGAAGFASYAAVMWILFLR